jgi:hypothetical protein
MEKNNRMSDLQASQRYPDSVILFRMDEMNSDMGTVLYVGDNPQEMYSIFANLADQSFCGVLEGINRQASLGGVVVYG